LNIDSVIKRITIDNPAKTISLFLAILLFVFHNINLLKTETISSKLRVEGSTNLIITNIIPESVSLTLRGDEKTIGNISENDIITFIDLSPYTIKGSYRAPIKVIKSGNALDGNTLEISVEPLDIMLQLDNVSEKYVSVSPAASGSLAAGYNLVSEKVTPSQLRIEGPLSLLSHIDTISTEPFDISGRYDDFSLLLNLVSPGPLFTVYGVNKVEYSAEVRSVYVEKEFSDIPFGVLNLNNDFNIKILPETGHAVLQGAPVDINNFTSEDTLLTINCSGIDHEGSFELPVNVNAGNSFKVFSYTPGSVIAVITKQEN
jgi:YbbR domain-containing protein